MTDVAIRRGAAEDLAAVTELYNYYVRETAITFDVEPYTVEGRAAWLGRFGESGRCQWFVAEGGQGGVLGYASSAPFRAKAAYAPSVETTVYVQPDAQGRGVGRLLYARLFEALAGEDVHRAYAGITLPNVASVALHDRFGFVAVGTFHEAGRKFGKYHDVLWMEKRFGE